jgi:PD-(D/E)XK nuclease superfamily
MFFGSAVDKALNHLLLTKNLDEAKDVFDKEFKTITLNGEVIDVEVSPKVHFLESDLDKDLLLPEDLDKANLSFWSLYRKGLIMVQSYHDFVLPKIKEVLVVQKEIEVTNDQGDVLHGVLDLIVKFHDDKVYLLDNKTSSNKYDQDAASNSTQLNLYNYLLKTGYEIDGIGFIVLNKNIWKKKTKVCSVCDFDGTGTNNRNCNNNDINGNRCKGSWNVKMNPSCYIDIILDEPNPRVENMILDLYDEVNANIKNNKFIPNFNSCKRGKFRCVYYEKCYNGSDAGLVIVEDSKKEIK